MHLRMYFLYKNQILHCWAGNATFWKTKSSIIESSMDMQTVLSTLWLQANTNTMPISIYMFWNAWNWWKAMVIFMESCKTISDILKAIKRPGKIQIVILIKKLERFHEKSYHRFTWAPNLLTWVQHQVLSGLTKVSACAKSAPHIITQVFALARPYQAYLGWQYRPAEC